MGWRHSSVAVTLLAEMAERQEAVGNRVVALREQKRWSQEELAGKAKLSTKTISRLENGRYESRRGTIGRVAAALGVEPEDLDPPPPAPLGLGAEPAQPVASSDLQLMREDVASLREDVSQLLGLIASIVSDDPKDALLRAQEALAQRSAAPVAKPATTKGRRGGRREAA